MAKNGNQKNNKQQQTEATRGFNPIPVDGPDKPQKVTPLPAKLDKVKE
ncbi:MAG: hypothetical protein JW712_12190 [Dehalococcoidales bacterium]|nr:hypothetical protein [Dehalococcoidales bacterium]